MIFLTYFFHFSACNCNTQGSYGKTCNDNGECSCKANIINDKCDACADGFFNFPTCQGKHYLHTFSNILNIELS